MTSRKSSFTLLEVIISITIFFIIFVTVISIYQKMLNIKYNIQAKQTLIQWSNDVVEKINLILRDYTIDYEEYFNRQRVWCVNTGTAGNTFTWDISTGGYCTRFTNYGNDNSFSAGKSLVYYCSSSLSMPETTPNMVLTGSIQRGSWCANTGWQSYGEYAQQFWDRKKDVDSIPGVVGDSDDENVMLGPPAILNATGVQELYLVSPNHEQRMFLRRALVESGDWNHDGVVSGDNEFLYTIQMLKLRWFDAGDHHNFSWSTSSGVYDGQIDTRACDISQWFVCHGSPVGTDIYSWYRLPQDADDGRVNLFDQDTTISDRNIILYPDTDPTYAIRNDSTQITPYFTISLQSKLYSKIRLKRIKPTPIDSFVFTLQTTFWVKSVYTQ